MSSSEDAASLFGPSAAWPCFHSPRHPHFTLPLVSWKAQQWGLASLGGLLGIDGWLAFDAALGDPLTQARVLVVPGPALGLMRGGALGRLCPHFLALTWAQRHQTKPDFRPYRMEDSSKWTPMKQ